MAEVVAGKGTRLVNSDLIAYCFVGSPSYSSGIFRWDIPYDFKVGNGALKNFINSVSQKGTVTSTGKLTIDKAGTSKSRDLSDPTNIPTWVPADIANCTSTN